MSDAGALAVDTGEFTGRAPKDKFIVKDDNTKDSVDWGGFNNAVDPAVFDNLYSKVVKYFEGKEIFVRDSYACADEDYRLNVRVVSEYPWSTLFAYNMFLRPSADEMKTIQPDWLI